MPTITDYEGNIIPGAPRTLPEGWSESRLRDGEIIGQYNAGWSGSAHAVVVYDHVEQCWEWRVYWGHSSVADHREYKNPCKTAMQAIRAAQRAARKHKINRDWAGE